MIETTLTGLNKDDLDNIRILYKKKILKAEAKAIELALEIETIRGVLDAIKQIQRDRNGQSLDDYAKDRGLEPTYEVYEEWCIQDTPIIMDENFEAEDLEDCK